ANTGSIQVSLPCEAMQDGKVGETINLMNLESKATVRGRIISATEAELAF
ncbi:MAG: flagella basal body P-ring formation protein FlgA, partial [Planctomycetes bacterium]|nr:flagella basal body P-ring formation protein FlgA [Planctomycetota bacterium]